MYVSPSLPSSGVGAIIPLNNSAPLAASLPLLPFSPFGAGGITVLDINSSPSSNTPL